MNDPVSPGNPQARATAPNAKLEAGSQLFVQRFVDRRHFYSASSITAHFVCGNTGDELADDLGAKGGTAFIVQSQTIRTPHWGSAPSSS
jgi:hypothetical protein